MVKRLNISTGAKWEEIVGYSRAVKTGNMVFVTGTVSVDKDGNVVGVDDAYIQTRHILKIIENVLNEAGSGLEDVVRTRMFVTDISRWEEYGKAHREIFGDIRPATTMVEVQKLISPQFLIEIEADAVVLEEENNE